MFQDLRSPYHLLIVAGFISICMTLYFIVIIHKNKAIGVFKEKEGSSVLKSVYDESIYFETYTNDIKNVDNKSDVPIILWYNLPFWFHGSYADGGDYLDGCPYYCEFITNMSRWNESSAVIIHTVHDIEPLEYHKPKDQLWIFFVLEPPFNYPTDYRKWDRMFNWTMTYRLDSDVPIIQHKIETTNRSKNDFSNLNKKTKSVSWAVSHCNSSGRREEYVNRLVKIIPVDIYGKCGNLSCPKYKIGRDCYKVFSKEHKFYLSFENSFCRDYISEKSYFPLSLNILPAVRGSSHYSSLLPPKSYINTDDFRSPEELGRYLVYLQNNDSAYRQYFYWKKYYESKPFCCRKQVYCNLCRRVHNKQKYNGFYESVHDWWTKGSNCFIPTDV